MIRRVLAASLGAAIMIGGAAEAHGPARQKAEFHVTLDASPAEVWEVIGHFDDLHEPWGETALSR